MDKVNVLMCVYNEELSVVRQAIDSIMHQTYRNVELVVVIDNPNRNDVNEYLDCCEKSIAVKCVSNEVNLGLAKSLNKGLALCDATYVLRMDADDVCMPYRIEAQVAYLTKNGCDLIGSYVQRINEDGKFLCNNSNFPVHDKSIKRMLLIENCIPHPTWLFVRELAIKLGGYRDIYAAEDYDFLVRAMLIQAKFGIIPEICLQYRVNTLGITQKNMALQKTLNRVIVQQYHENRIFSIDEFQQYLFEKQELLERRASFYSYVKKKNKKLSDVLRIIFNVTIIDEFRTRLVKKLIFFFDQVGWKDKL